MSLLKYSIYQLSPWAIFLYGSLVERSNIWYCTVKYIQRVLATFIISVRVSFFLLKPIISQEIKGINLSFTKDKLIAVRLNTCAHTRFHVGTWTATVKYSQKTLFCNTDTPTVFFSPWLPTFNIPYINFCSRTFFTPLQVWVDRTGEVSSQHASRTAVSRGHCAHNSLDPDFGSVSCSTGKICSDKIAPSSFFVCSCPELFSTFIIYLQSSIFGSHVNHLTLGTNPLQSYPGWFQYWKRGDSGYLPAFCVYLIFYVSTFCTFHLESRLFIFIMVLVQSFTIECSLWQSPWCLFPVFTIKTQADELHRILSNVWING